MNLLKIEDVYQRLGVCRSQVYRLIHTEAFPVPVSVGPGTARWLADEVDEWLRSRTRRNVRVEKARH